MPLAALVHFQILILNGTCLGPQSLGFRASPELP